MMILWGHSEQVMSGRHTEYICVECRQHAPTLPNTWAVRREITPRGITRAPETLLTHWDRVTHICVSKTTIIGPDNGLLPGRHQAIIWTKAKILSIRTLGTNFGEILRKIYTFSFKKMHLKMSSAKWRQFYLGLNVLTLSGWICLKEKSNNNKHMKHSQYTSRCLPVDARSHRISSQSIDLIRSQ